MRGETTKIRSRSGGELDCYIVAPKSRGRVPGIVLASAVHGVDHDMRTIADEFANEGFIAAAPDLFWRSTPGPLSRRDDRAGRRSQPRLERINTGASDMSDTLAYLRTLSNFNGCAAVMGFCYGGPYAVIGPKRLGFAAGIACHGSQMLDFVGELEDIDAPVCIIWGDKDELAPPHVIEAYCSFSSRMSNVELHIIRDVLHGFMMRGSDAFHLESYDFAIAKALGVLCSLNGAPACK